MNNLLAMVIKPAQGVIIQPSNPPIWLTLSLLITCLIAILSVAYFSWKRPRLLLVMPVLILLPLMIFLIYYFLGLFNFSNTDLFPLVSFATVFTVITVVIISVLFSLGGLVPWLRTRSNTLARRRFIYGLFALALFILVVMVFNVVTAALGLGIVYLNF